MTKETLHIIRNQNAFGVLELIKRQGSTASNGNKLLLIQDAVGLSPEVDLPIFVLEEDLVSRGLSSIYTQINYKEMMDMIWDAERVLAW